jgi:hypothetical protein
MFGSSSFRGKRTERELLLVPAAAIICLVVSGFFVGSALAQDTGLSASSSAPDITASSTPLLPVVEQMIVTGPELVEPVTPVASKIVIVAASSEVVQGANSGVMGVQLQDETGKPVDAITPLTLEFSSDSSSAFFTDANETNCTGIQLDNKLTLSSTKSLKRFCYQDSISGDHTITVSVQENGWTASLPIKVIANSPSAQFTFVGLDSVLPNSQARFSITAAAVSGIADTRLIRYKALITKNSLPLAGQEINYPEAGDDSSDISTWHSFSTDANGVAFFGPTTGFPLSLLPALKSASGISTNFAAIFGEGTYTLKISIVDALTGEELASSALREFSASYPPFDFGISPAAGSRVGWNTVFKFNNPGPSGSSNCYFAGRPAGASCDPDLTFAGLSGFSTLADGPFTMELTVHESTGRTSSTTISYIKDTTGPNLTAGFIADGLVMSSGSLAHSFVLLTDRQASREYKLQFTADSVPTEELKEEIVGLFLDPAAGQTDLLRAYYMSKPEAYRTYLNAAASGALPFAYIKTGGTVVRLLDGARYNLARLETDMAIPGDFPLGNYRVSGTISDNLGNASTTSFVLVVGELDTTPPVITIESFNTDPTKDEVVVRASTNEGTLNATSHTFSENGEFTFIATDAAGNRSEKVVTVSNIDKAAPVISGIPTDLNLEAAGPTGATGIFEHPTASDAYDGPTTVSCSFLSGTLFPLGETTVQCTAMDRAGNSSSVNFKVNVRDTTAPVIGEVPPDLTFEAAGSRGVSVNYRIPSATDAVSEVTVICDHLPGAYFPLGATKVTCSAKDAAGNESIKSFTFTVRDTTAPVISNLPSDLVIEATSSAGSVAEYVQPTATDLVDGSLTVACAPTAGSIFTLGTTKVVCSVKDAAGNEASSSFSVLVRDTTAPVIKLEGVVTDKIPFGTIYNDPGATASDLVDGNLTVQIENPLNINVPGEYLIIYSAFDRAGNIASTTRSVRVENPPAHSPGGIVPGFIGARYGKYDFARMMAEWGKTGYSVSDLNRDNIVDKYDLALLMANWAA